MKQSIKDMLDQIAEDRLILRDKMVWEADPNALATLSAFLYAGAGRKADIDRYVECKNYLKKTVSTFSEIRGIISALVITKMTLQDDYKTYLDGVVTVYKKLRSIHTLMATPHMVLTACNIYEAGGLLKADENIAKLENVFDRLQANHFFLTSDEDRPFIATLISRDVNIDAIIDEIENCYNASKGMSFSKDSMHAASQILALSGKPTDEKVAELQATITALKADGVGGMKYELMPVAAALTFTDGSPEEKAAEIKEAYDYLKTKKGFGALLSSTKRAMYAALAYALCSINSDTALFNSVISTSITNIIINEIIDYIIIISIVTSSTTSSIIANS